jgi:hypothetical protein|tara:strand:- start:178 stop:345 length:168 start_codon:yes stop_codon:yes gene_type:complete
LLVLLGLSNIVNAHIAGEAGLDDILHGLTTGRFWVSFLVAVVIVSIYCWLCKKYG